MPRLLIFTPCERVIYGTDNSLSLINVFHGMTLNIVENDPIPPGASFQFRWSVFTMWLKQPEDEGMDYKQRVVLRDNAGGSLVESVTPFVMKKPAHRITASFPGFPLAPGTDYKLELALSSEQDAEWKIVSDFPLSVKYVQRHDTVTTGAIDGES